MQAMLDAQQALLQAFDPESIGQKQAERDLDLNRLGYQMAGLQLLIQPKTTAEVIEYPSLARIPNTADWCRGMTQVRSNLVPVFDLHLLLDKPLQNKPWLLILEAGKETAALVVDGLPYTLSAELLHATAIPSAFPDSYLEPFIDSAYQYQSNSYWQLDHKALFEQLSKQVAA